MVSSAAISEHIPNSEELSTLFYKQRAKVQKVHSLDLLREMYESGTVIINTGNIVIFHWFFKYTPLSYRMLNPSPSLCNLLRSSYFTDLPQWPHPVRPVVAILVSLQIWCEVLAWRVCHDRSILGPDWHILGLQEKRLLSVSVLL